MMNDQTLLHQTMAQQLVLRELLAAMLAELAMLSDDPKAKLEMILGNEEGASIQTVGQLDLENPVTLMIVTEMDSYRDEIFELSRKVLIRMMAARNTR